MISIGLRIKFEIPILISFNRYSASLWAEITMIFCVLFSAKIASLIAIPFIFGMLISVKTIS